MVKPTLLVLAAGMGSRYGSLKQMDGVGPNGEAIIDYSVYDAIRAGFGKVVFVIRHSFEADFKEVFNAERFGGKIAVEYVFQELDYLPEGFTLPEGRVKPWGTGHAIWCCRNAVDSPFAVINADDYYGPKAFQLVYDHLTAPKTSDKPEYMMAGYILKNTLTDNGSVSRGVCVVENNQLVSIEENKKIEKGDGVAISTKDDGSVVDLPLDSVVSMNFFGFTPDLFQKLEEGMVKFMAQPTSDPLKREYLLPEEVENLLRAGYCTVKVAATDDRWYGVTYPEDKQMVTDSIRALVAGGAYPQNLWA